VYGNVYMLYRLTAQRMMTDENVNEPISLELNNFVVNRRLAYFNISDEVI